MGIRLGHFLLGGLIQGHDSLCRSCFGQHRRAQMRRKLTQHGRRLSEDFPVKMIEARGTAASKLKMLALIFSDGYVSGTAIG